MEGFDEIINEFLVESYESLDQLDSDFMALEESPEDRDRLASIFRTVHTIKGTSGFLAFEKLEKVAHVGENLLVPLRDGALKLNRDMADSLLGMVDAIREILQNIEGSGTEGDVCFDDLISKLQSQLDGSAGGNEAVVDAGDPSGEQATETPEQSDCETANDDSAEGVADDAAAEGESSIESTPEPADSAAESSQSASATQQSKLQSQSKPKAAERSQGGGSKSLSLADSSVRIDVNLLDTLMNLVGELVLSRNQILQFSAAVEDAGLVDATQRLNQITSELQEGVMKTRMQPIQNAWSKLPRVVRDLASSCGKKVEVRMEGAETELDKTILEAIKDPLTHIVRNSVDHGIEPTETRVANGKPPVGTLVLRAYHEGGQVNIEISDDGGGISAERIRAKAIEKNLITETQAETLSERELVNLILLPGFSTAEKVTNVSGRGVGMDVVKTNIEKIGGTLEIQSEAGVGTTLKIKIPLTLAIVPALIIASGRNHYAIPQVNLLELVRLSRERSREIEFIHDTPVYRLRGKLLPLIFLDEQLGLRQKRQPDEYEQTINIVVLRAEDRTFGLVVDSVTDTQEIVVKPLGVHLQEIHSFVGATIMGDGKVALILDALGLAQKGNVLNEKSDHAVANSDETNNEGASENRTLLIVESDGEQRLAIELSSVARLEEFEIDAIEQSREGSVIQYRGSIMPLVNLGHGLTADGSDKVHVVVYTCGQYSVGVVVGRIVDIIETNIKTGPGTEQQIIQERVTEMVDLEAFVRSHVPHVFEYAAAAESV